MPSAALKNALQGRLDLLQQLWERRDSDAIVRELYTENTEITGAGSAALYSGSVQLRELLAALVTDSRGASIRIDRLTALGDNAAYTWVTWRVLPLDGEAFSMKSLFVWCLVDGAWRVLADMYAEGEIPA
ncbi:nuclear transport factor 2 family protein [Pseudomonas sp. 148P]|uniref:Nuclear transport factor 2 family protein n=1 Tax=Pseudomonas ulcerans TaxID=3115852 RepID=A0ABU7HZD7_9PSED|nr:MULTISPECIES: nuclear transport factor 2 family protein [unclassified Pseudomonas]MEE1925476.1 nuclear transport factor 2 family protein [Pseudomonas sp. 147P]MEE1936924.1 nuclear transport factor 2 family protein [Pseudomonas sp. 148P]